MRVVWMPYATLSVVGQPQADRFSIGSAQFIRDSDEMWQSEFGISRPPYLQVYREFAGHGEEVGGPCYGTIVCSEDDDYLQTHIESLVAIVFFLCDRANGSLPAERFTALSLSIDTENFERALVTINLKHGRLIEGDISLRIPPPIAIRSSRSELRLDAERSENAALVGRCRANPNDRIVAAVVHYFRSHLSELFSAPTSNDYYRFCAAIEAALDFQERQATGERFVNALIGIYGNDPDSVRFFHGWYVARNAHVHGLQKSGSPSSTGLRHDELQDLRFFDSLRGKWTLCRNICRETILRQLGFDPSDHWFDSSPDDARALLSTILRSNRLQQDALRLLTDNQAAKNVVALMTNTDSDLGLREMASRLNESFSWQCVEEMPSTQRILRALATCAIVFTRVCAEGTEVHDAALQLGSASDSGSDAVRNWAIEHLAWKDLYAGPNLQNFQIIAWRVASYFASEFDH